MQSYQEIINQIEDLQKQAEKIRETERAAAITEIKEKIAIFAISAEELGLTSTGKRPSTKGKSNVKAKYRDPVSGATWSGRGKMPVWLKEQVDAGKSKDAYLI